MGKAIVKGFLEIKKQRLIGLRYLMLVLDIQGELHGIVKMGAVRLHVLTGS